MLPLFTINATTFLLDGLRVSKKHWGVSQVNRLRKGIRVSSASRTLGTGAFDQEFVTFNLIRTKVRVSRTESHDTRILQHLFYFIFLLCILLGAGRNGIRNPHERQCCSCRAYSWCSIMLCRLPFSCRADPRRSTHGELECIDTLLLGSLPVACRTTPGIKSNVLFPEREVPSAFCDYFDTIDIGSTGSDDYPT